MIQVNASIVAAFVSALSVTVAPTAEDQCPSAAQVHAAIQTHAPGLIGTSFDDAPTTALTLSLTANRATGELGMSLVDRAGATKLFRVLPPPVGDRARDCVALADTVALIVERYFNELPLPALPEKAQPGPLPTPPPSKAATTPNVLPPFEVAGTVGRRIPGAAEDFGGVEFKLVLGAPLIRLGKSGGAIWADLAGGLVSIANGPGDESPSAVRYGGDLALMLARPVWHGRIFFGPQGTLDMMQLNTIYGTHEQRYVRFSGAVGLKLSYHLAWRNFFFRLDANGCATLFPIRVMAKPNDNTALFATPAAYVTIAGGVGVSF